MNAVGNIPDFPSTFYVDVCDSADTPKVFVHEAAALNWAAEHHPDWKVDNEDVRTRWAARKSYEGAVEEAQQGGWYRPGPVPDPVNPNAPDDFFSVYIAHSGLTTFIWRDRSDAEATSHVWSLSPEHGARHHLHTVHL